jgi:hypothetical protein
MPAFRSTARQEGRQQISHGDKSHEGKARISSSGEGLVSSTVGYRLYRYRRLRAEGDFGLRDGIQLSALIAAVLFSVSLCCGVMMADPPCEEPAPPPPPGQPVQGLSPGMPQAENTTAAANSSGLTAEQQFRILEERGLIKVAPNGMVSVQQLAIPYSKLPPCPPTDPSLFTPPPVPPPTPGPPSGVPGPHPIQPNSP